MAGGGLHDPEARDRRAEAMWRAWRYKGLTQSEVARRFKVSRVWANAEINRFMRTERGEAAQRRYERIRVEKTERPATKSQVRRARTLDMYRAVMRDVIGGMTVREAGAKYGRSYQSILKGFRLLRDADPDLYSMYVRANRSHRFGWDRRRAETDGDADSGGDRRA